MSDPDTQPVTAIEASEAAALQALYADARLNETLAETVARLRRPRFAEALADAALRVWRDLHGDPMNDHPDLTIDATERGRTRQLAPADDPRTQAIARLRNLLAFVPGGVRIEECADFVDLMLAMILRNEADYIRAKLRDRR
jgi:hypothetical protein